MKNLILILSLLALTAETLFKESETPETKIEALEKEINELVEQSTLLVDTDPKKALNIAANSLKTVFFYLFYFIISFLQILSICILGE